MEGFEENYRSVNVLQAELLKRHPDWIENHAANFRETFLSEHPEIVEEFEKDPEEAIRKVERTYYH